MASFVVQWKIILFSNVGTLLDVLSNPLPHFRPKQIKRYCFVVKCKLILPPTPTHTHSKRYFSTLEKILPHILFSVRDKMWERPFLSQVLIILLLLKDNIHETLFFPLLFHINSGRLCELEHKLTLTSNHAPTISPHNSHFSIRQNS